MAFIISYFKSIIITKTYRILLILGIAIVILLFSFLLFFQFVVGINYFKLDKTYNYEEISELAIEYSNNNALLIKKNHFSEYGSGRFPKYRIYNKNGIMLNVYACYESLPIIDKIIRLRRDSIVDSELFLNEIEKIREINDDTLWKKSVFDDTKFNMIFYYKNAMKRVQKKQLYNLLNHNLGNFNDSINLIFVNVDKVNF